MTSGEKSVSMMSAVHRGHSTQHGTMVSLSMATWAALDQKATWGHYQTSQAA